MKISGLGGLRATLSRLPRIAEQAAEDECLEVAEAIAEEAIQRSPNESGQMDEETSVVRTENGAAVEWDADHTAAVEYGTSKMDAQPFIRPTVEEIGPAATTDACRRAGRRIEQAASR